MALQEKYQTIIDKANQLGVTGLNLSEGDGVLHIDGAAPTAEAKQQLWDEYGRIDPEYRTGDLILNISAPEGAKTHTVEAGDNLSKIGEKYNVSWQKIFEANRDKLDDPDKISPGQELKIPEA
jgi:nucleoid-associated protein YgaU